MTKWSENYEAKFKCGVCRVMLHF